MKTGLPYVAALVAAAALPAFAASPVTSGSRDALFVSDGLENWSIGIDGASIRRGVDLEGFPDRLEATYFGGFVGWRAVPWLTIYGVLGQAEAEIGIDNLDDGMYWALGANATVWQYDMTDPEFLTGRWSIRVHGEFAAADLTSGEWQDLSGSLRLQYEIFTEAVEATQRMPYSLALFAGPMVSVLDGKVELLGITDDFEADDEVGVVAGLELSISHNVLLGLGAEILDDTTWVGSLRYKF